MLAQQIRVDKCGRGNIIGKEIVLFVLAGVHLLEYIVGLDEQAERLVYAAVNAVLELLADHGAVFFDHLVVSV